MTFPLRLAILSCLLLIGSARAQTVNDCTDFTNSFWSYNSLDQSPCTVAASLLAVCNDSPYTNTNTPSPSLPDWSPEPSTSHVTPYTSSFKASTTRPRPTKAPPPPPPQDTTYYDYSYSYSYYYTTYYYTIYYRGISQDRDGIRRRSEADDACNCNTVMYNLISACNACQGDSWTDYATWSLNCTTRASPGTFPSPIPYGVRVPEWAFIDTSTSNFSVSEAQAVGDYPEVTGTTHLSTPTVLATRTPNLTPGLSNSAPSGLSHVVAIVGSVAAGIAAVLIVWVV